jgi:hypothetical protein
MLIVKVQEDSTAWEKSRRHAFQGLAASSGGLVSIISELEFSSFSHRFI